MPDIASPATATSPLAGMLAMGAAPMAGAADKAVDGGFQAMLDLQPRMPLDTMPLAPAPDAAAAADAASDPALAQIAMPAAMALGGNGILPPPGKILPPSAAAKSENQGQAKKQTPEADTMDHAADPMPAPAPADPALALMTNAAPALPAAPQPLAQLSPTPLSPPPGAPADAAAPVRAGSARPRGDQPQTQDANQPSTATAPQTVPDQANTAPPMVTTPLALPVMVSSEMAPPAVMATPVMATLAAAADPALARMAKAPQTIPLANQDASISAADTRGTTIPIRPLAPRSTAAGAAAPGDPAAMPASADQADNQPSDQTPDRGDGKADAQAPTAQAPSASPRSPAPTPAQQAAPAQTTHLSPDAPAQTAPQIASPLATGTLPQATGLALVPIAQPDPATPRISQAPAAGPDMAALVDRLVEARQAARSGAGAQTVQATITHAEFGRVALNFRQDGDGMTVSMASSDPGFAPAAQAALAQAAQAAQTTQPAASADGGQTAGNPSQGHGQTFTPQSGGSPSGQNSQGQTPQGQQATRWPTPRDATPRPAAAEDTTTTLSRRSGILA